MKFSLLGCYPTQNALKLFQKNVLKTLIYAPKLSIATIQSDMILEGVPSVDGLNLENDIFTKKLIEYDLKKNLLSDVINSGTNVLLIDFFEDTYSYLLDSYTGHSLTKSNYLVKHKLCEKIFKNYRTVDCFSDEGMMIWKKGCDSFHKHVSNSAINICLVKGYYPEYYIDANKSKAPLQGKILDYVKAVNVRLEKCYTYFEHTIKCDVITISDERLAGFLDNGYGIKLSNTNLDYSKAIVDSLMSLYSIEKCLIAPRAERIQTLFQTFGSLLESGQIPSIAELYQEGRAYLDRGLKSEAHKCEQLIQILHNSSVPLSVELGKHVSFAYGGIGTIIHSKCKIGDFVVIGSNVTIGGGNTTLRNNNGKMEQRQIPIIESRVFIATGAKILGGITVGHHSIIGANSVITKDIPPHSVVVGNPSKIITTITIENYVKYAKYLYKGTAPEEIKRSMFGNEINI